MEITASLIIQLHFTRVPMVTPLSNPAKQVWSSKKVAIAVITPKEVQYNHFTVDIW